MSESVELLKHGLKLYEEGYFDCAFYSVRQSVENMNNMLYLSTNNAELKNWKAKGRFPPDSKIKKLLEEAKENYSKIKSAIPEVFNNYDELLKKANKYIHKQGFDTFYLNSWQPQKVSPSRTKLFISLLKQSIGLVIIINIALDPLALALSDPEVDAHIPFDFMTGHTPTWILEEIFSAEIILKIKQTTFYREFIQFFLEKERLNEATYDVVRNQYYDVTRLDEIFKQIHILNTRESLCFRLLQHGFQISHFYFQDDFFGYSTSISPAHHQPPLSSNQFDKYYAGTGKQNIAWNEMYISVYQTLNTYIVLQHNERMSEDSLIILQEIITEANQSYHGFKTKAF